MNSKEKEYMTAVHIAAVIMQADGLCRYEDPAKCRRYFPTNEDCVKCIERWLLAKARKVIANDR